MFNILHGAQHYALPFIIVIGIVPQIMAVGVSFFFREPRVHIHEHQKSFHHLTEACIKIWKNPRLRLLMLGQAISYGAGESNYQFKATFVGSLWPGAGAGLYRAGVHFINIFTFWFSSFILKYIKPAHFLAIREVWWFVTQMIAVFIENFISPVLFMSGALVYPPGEVAHEYLLQNEFTDGQRATMGSVISFASSIAYAIMAFAIGWLADHFGLAAGVGFGVIAGVFSLPIYVYLFRKYF
jgi:fucose permease